MKSRTSIIIEAVGYVGLRGFICGFVFGAAFGTLIYPLIGTLYGAFIGAIVGTPLGMVGGLIIGLITALHFNPIRNPQDFRWTLRLVGGAVSFIGAYAGFALLFWSGDPISDSLGIPLIPALVATACAIYVSHSYAEYYLRQKRKSRRLDIAE